METFKSAKLFDANGDLDKRWFVFYYFRDPETNKWVRLKEWISQTLLTKSSRYARAGEIIKRINLKLRQGFNPFADNNKGLTSIMSALDNFLTSKGYSVRQRTIFSYRSYIKQFKEWLVINNLNNTSVESFSFYQAQDYMDYCCSRKKIKNRTFNNILSALRCIFNFFIEKEMILVNPFNKVKEFAVEESEIIAFSRDDLDIVHDHLPTFCYELYVISLLIFSCFLRPQEIVRLRIRHLKNINDRITIPGNVSKNKKNEGTTVPRQLKQAIRGLQLDYPDDYYVFGKNLKPSEKPTAPTRIAGKWKKFSEKYGIRKNIYALKHTGNGMALERGINTRDLQLQNRHSSLEMTQKYLDRCRRTPSDRFINDFPEL